MTTFTQGDNSGLTSVSIVATVSCVYAPGQGLGAGGTGVVLHSSPMGKVCVGLVRGGGSEGDAGTVVFELAGQDTPVQLVELNQLDQISEASMTIVQAVVQVPVFIHLPSHTQTHARVRHPRGGFLRQIKECEGSSTVLTGRI